MEETQQVNVRIAKSEMDQIDEFVANGDFTNRAEFVKFAIRKVLKTYQSGDRLNFKPKL